MRIAVVGSRRFPFPSLVIGFIEGLVQDQVTRGRPVDEIEIVSGGAEGVDHFAVETAKRCGMRWKEFLPHYDEYDELHQKQAPLARNQEIVDYCEKLIAFWDGKSGGTRDVINKAHVSDKRLAVVTARISDPVRFT